MDSAASQTHIKLAGFRLGDKLFAVDIMRIREIITPPERAPMPCASELLDGIITLRGAVIPVMELRKRFGLQPDTKQYTDGQLLIVKLVGQLLALAVDEVLEVISVPVTELKAPIVDSSAAGMAYIMGACIAGSRVFMILNIDELLMIPPQADV